MAISIKSVLTTHIKCFKYLQDDSGNLFSIKKWMYDETSTDSILIGPQPTYIGRDLNEIAEQLIERHHVSS